jgi:hypothetical protein
MLFFVTGQQVFSCFLHFHVFITLAITYMKSYEKQKHNGITKSPLITPCCIIAASTSESFAECSSIDRSGGSPLHKVASLCYASFCGTDVFLIKFGN